MAISNADIYFNGTLDELADDEVCNHFWFCFGIGFGLFKINKYCKDAKSIRCVVTLRCIGKWRSSIQVRISIFDIVIDSQIMFLF